MRSKDMVQNAMTKHQKRSVSTNEQMHSSILHLHFTRIQIKMLDYSSGSVLVLMYSIFSTLQCAQKVILEKEYSRV